MKSKQLHTERHPIEQNFHLNINLQLPLTNLKCKLRNGNVTHVPADYAKNVYLIRVFNNITKCFSENFRTLSNA